MKRKIIVGVWKDKLSLAESVNQATKLNNIFKDKKINSEICIAPAPAALWRVKDEVTTQNLHVIAQDIHWPDEKRSFIGSTPIAYLKELGIKTTMVGHSERRRFFYETNEDIYKKLFACINEGIYPILAIGDNVTCEKERADILRAQIKGALCPDGLPPINTTKICIGYEPIWAISTWRNEVPLPDYKVVNALMNMVADLLDEFNLDISQTPLLYGGSVAPSNAEEYFSVPLVDGALVGGASLKAESLTALCDIGEKVWFSN